MLLPCKSVRHLSAVARMTDWLSTHYPRASSRSLLRAFVNLGRLRYPDYRVSCMPCALPSRPWVSYAVLFQESSNCLGFME